jgi:hypothetical protein
VLLSFVSSYKVVDINSELFLDMQRSFVNVLLSLGSKSMLPMIPSTVALSTQTLRLALLVTGLKNFAASAASLLAPIEVVSKDGAFFLLKEGQHTPQISVHADRAYASSCDLASTAW